MTPSLTKTPIRLSSLNAAQLAKILSLNDIDLLALDKHKNIWLINCVTGNSQTIATLSDFIIDDRTQIQIKLSPCANYAAFTFLNYDLSENRGCVIRLPEGGRIFELKDYGYHSDKTTFPVAFFKHQDQCLMVYASEWNNLDIINLQSGKCLTTRSDDDITEEMRNPDAFTEWAGELNISPDGKRLATIGWVWHPVGVAWNFSLENWLKNKWESDFGSSKKILGYVWDYFWDSPFAWLDNERIIIWGDPETQQNDLPANNAIIYNAITGEKLFAFDGPTMDIFEVDGPCLVSGTNDRSGISIWDWSNGQLLATLPIPLGDSKIELQLLTYQQQQHQFIACDQDQLYRLTLSPDVFTKT
jgi:hypothetical protein